jgi:hypothetical protein
MDSDTNETARQQCYQRLREVMKQQIQEYYRGHPDRLMDERSEEAIKYSVEGLKAMFAILDQYLIEEKPELKKILADIDVKP